MNFLTLSRPQKTRAKSSRMSTCHIPTHGQLEVALRQAEAQDRSIFENALHDIFLIAAEGSCLAVNPALVRMCGHETPQELTEQLTGLGPQPYVNPTSQAEFKSILEKQGSVQGLKSQVYRKDGRVMWISEHAHAVRDDNETLLYSEGNIEDLSAHRRAQNVWRLCQRLLDASPDDTSVVGRDYAFRRVNAAYEKTHDLPSQNIVEKYVSGLLGEDTFTEVVKSRLDRCLAGEEVVYESWFHFKGIGRRCMFVTYTPLQAGSNHIEGIIVVSPHIAEQKQAEEDLKTANQQLREIAAHSESPQEEKRIRIAREIHDEMSSLLMALDFNLTWQEDQLSLTNDEPLRATVVSKMLSTLKQVEKTVQ